MRLVALLACLSALAGCAPSRTLSPDQSDPVAIGLVVPLTGELGSDGQDRLDGVRLAVREVNAAGGVLPGRRVRLLFEDSESDPDRATMRARDLVAQGAVALLGDAASQSTLQILTEVSSPSMLPHASGHSTASSLTRFQEMLAPSERFFFRTVPDDAEQGPALAQAMYDAGCRFLGIAAFDDPDYALPLAASTRASFEQWITASGATGGVFGEVLLGRDEASYPEEAVMLAAAVPDPTMGPSCIAVFAYAASGGRFMRSWSELPPPAPTVSFFATDSLRRVGFVTEAGSCDTVRGVRGTAAISDPSTPAYNAFARAFRNTFGRAPASFTSSAYDATALMLLAIARAGSVDPVEIRDAVREVATPPGTLVDAADLATALRLIREGEDIDYDGASGAVDVDELGNVSGVFELWRYDGAMPCASTPDPSEFVRVGQIFPRAPGTTP